MKSIDEILNATGDEADQTDTDAEVDAEESTEEDEATGATTQVAAEESDADEAPAQIKGELSALAKERARIREKEVKLDAKLAELSSTSDTAAETTTAVTTGDLKTELKSLRKQHRDALLEGVEENELEALEEKMEEVRLSIYNQTNQIASAQERINSDFKSVYSEVHGEFPFLQVDHPDVNQELNEDINAHYLGRMQKGDPPAVALRKAVDKFAPAYAKTLGLTVDSATTDKSAAEKARKTVADKLVREKLGKSGFSEVRSVGKAQATKPFTGPTPMEDILKKAS